MGVRIYRTRRTRLVWRVERTRVTVTVGRTPKVSPEDVDEPALLVDFEIEASGGGGTRLSVAVTPDAFDQVLRAMASVDRKAVEAVFAGITRWAPAPAMGQPRS